MALPIDVNTSDEVVGTSCDQAETLCIPFVYQRNTKPGTTNNWIQTPLTAVAPGLVPPSHPWVFINNKGEILTETVHNGQMVPALLIPHGCVNP